MLGELRRRVVEDVARVDLGGRDLERLGAVLLGQREVGVVDELEGVFVVLVELVGERALCAMRPVSMWLRLHCEVWCGWTGCNS